MHDRSVKEFIKEVQTLNLEWFLDDLDEMVCYIDDTLYCPLTALYYTKTGEYKPRSQGVEAGKALGYSEAAAEYIRRLADDDFKFDEYDYSTFDKHLELLKKLIKPVAKS